MTLNRLIHPDSEHAMPRWIRSTALADILGVDLTALADDPLYRNLDRLHPQPRRHRVRPGRAGTPLVPTRSDRSISMT